MQYSDYEDPQFQKVFEFERTHEWRLPKVVYAAPNFKIPELQDMKKELNYVKSKLNHFDLGDWSLHTRNRDPGGYIISHLKRRIKPELLTQAWCKFYEVISTFPVIQLDGASRFRSIHLCEAPGAFICALNHYLVLNYPNVCWQWYANTLNPDYEGNPPSHMISDDRLISYTLKHWLFGVDLTGDILKYYNHVDLVNEATAKGKVNLVTADGSIDCMSDPGEQEKLVEYLQYCETITALEVLNTGGSFVLKIFTIFEESTVCLLYLLNCIFDKTYLFKPCTSKSGNSELYLVCVQFNGHNVLSLVWETLKNPYKNGSFDKNISMFSIDDIPNSFKIQLKSCCADFFLEKQLTTINDNIYYYQNPDTDEKKILHNRKIEIANYFIKKYQLVQIPKDCRVVPYLDVYVRRRDLSMSRQNQSVSFKDWFLSEFVDIALGKKIDTVYTSKFASSECIQNLIKYLGNNQDEGMLYSIIKTRLAKSATVINVKSFNLSHNHTFQKDLFNSIFAALNNETHIIFINVPFHTSFLAALWSISASAFENVYFSTGWCLFYKPVPTKVKLAKNIFSTIEKTYKNICSNIFPCDILYIFAPHVFSSDLSSVSEILKVYNTFQLPLF